MKILSDRSSFLSIIPEDPIVAITGAGGKTTLMFACARILPDFSVATTTTKVGPKQIEMADACFELAKFPPEKPYRSMWVSPSLEPANGKISGCSPEEFSKLAEICRYNHFSLLCEADGAKCRHIKAPAAHEPVIPNETNVSIYVTGLDVIGLPVNSQTVHRPELFSEITGKSEGEIIDADSIVKLLDHPEGGLKNIPEKALKVVCLTHINSGEYNGSAEYISQHLNNYDYVVTYNFKQDLK